MENSSTPSVMVWSAVRVLLVALIFIAPVFVGFSILFWLWIVVSIIRQAILYWLRQCYNYGLLLFKMPFYYIVAGDLYAHHRSLLFLRFVLAVCKIFISLSNIRKWCGIVQSVNRLCVWFAYNYRRSKYWSMFSWGGENTNGTYLGSLFRIILRLGIKFSLLTCDNIFFWILSFASSYNDISWVNWHIWFFAEEASSTC